MEKEVLRTGIFKDSSGKTVKITKKTLSDLAKNFNNEKSLNIEGYKVPLVLGHPSDESKAPALGWIKSLFHKGESLFAEIEKLTDEAEKAIKNFSFRDVSVSIFKNILWHIGLTNTPAVPNLADFQFENPYKNKTQILTYFQKPINNKGDTMSEKEIELVGKVKDLEVKLEKSNSKIEELETKLTEETEKTAVLTTEKNEIQKDKEAAEAKNKELETKIEDNEKAAELAKDTETVEKLIESGKLDPSEKENVLAVLQAFPKQNIKLSKGNEKTSKELYVESLEKRGVKLTSGEEYSDGDKISDKEQQTAKLVQERQDKYKEDHNTALAAVLAANPKLNVEG